MAEKENQPQINVGNFTLMAQHSQIAATITKQDKIMQNLIDFSLDLMTYGFTNEDDREQIKMILDSILLGNPYTKLEAHPPAPDYHPV